MFAILDHYLKLTVGVSERLVRIFPDGRVLSMQPKVVPSANAVTALSEQSTLTAAVIKSPGVRSAAAWPMPPLSEPAAEGAGSRQAGIGGHTTAHLYPSAGRGLWFVSARIPNPPDGLSQTAVADGGTLVRLGDLEMLEQNYHVQLGGELIDELEACFRAWCHQPTEAPSSFLLPSAVPSKGKKGGGVTASRCEFSSMCITHLGRAPVPMLRAAVAALLHPVAVASSSTSPVVICHGESGPRGDTAGLACADRRVPEWYWSSDLVSTSGSKLIRPQSKDARLRFTYDAASISGSGSKSFKWVAFETSVSERLERAHQFSVRKCERVCVQVDRERFVDVQMLLMRKCSDPMQRRMVMREHRGVVLRSSYDTAYQVDAAAEDAASGAARRLASDSESFIFDEAIAVPKLIRALGGDTEHFYRSLLLAGKKEMRHSKLLIVGPGRVGAIRPGTLKG